MDLRHKGITLLTLAGFGALTALADAKTWNGTTGLWSDDAKWSPTGAPQDGDDVSIPSGNYTLTIAAPSKALASFTQGGGTLLFTNWVTKLEAATITLNGGTITHVLCDTNAAPGNTNRIWIAANDLTVGSSAKINADEVGFRGGFANNGSYTNGQGTGGGRFGTSYGSAGGGYGGKGGGPYNGNGQGGITYGSLEMPLEPGSGGAGSSNQKGGNGGGAICLEIANTLTVNGSVSANGQKGSGGGGGSGGGIYIQTS